MNNTYISMLPIDIRRYIYEFVPFEKCTHCEGTISCYIPRHLGIYCSKYCRIKENITVIFYMNKHCMLVFLVTSKNIFISFAITCSFGISVVMMLPLLIIIVYILRIKKYIITII